MRRAPTIDLGRASVLAMSLTLASGAHAAPPASLHISGEDGACPSAAQVATVLKRLLRRTAVTADANPAASDDASIADQGAQFRVTVAGQERSFVDPARGCAERAQHAAVFVALILDPPIIAEPPPEPVAPAPAPPPAPRAAEQPPPPPPSEVKSVQWDFSLGGIFLVAPGVPDRKTALTGGAQAWIRGQRGFHLGLGAGLLRGGLDFQTASANAWWIPIDAAAGFTIKNGASEVAVEIGPSVSILSIVGEGLEQARRQTRLDVGVRASTAFRFWFEKKFAFYLSADAILRPVPYALQIDPDGQVGQTPSLWLGGSAGLSAALE